MWTMWCCLDNMRARPLSGWRGIAGDARRGHHGRDRFLEHFSVDWPKERARRQYAQYGEREATQGKSLKNAPSIKRALHFPFIQFDFREIQGVTRWQQKKWYSAIKPAPKSSKASIFWPMQLK